MRINEKTDKGVAGLTILLSLVTMLFVIGLIVMIFALMGGELRDATYTSTDLTVTNETHIANTTLITFTLDQSTLLSASCGTASLVVNSSNGVVIGTGNYSQSGCVFNVSTASTSVAQHNWNVSYIATYDAENTATRVMNDTTAGISGVTDWFDIFIVIGAMVVLVLLTVIIITAIRGSGLMNGGGA